MIRSLLVGRDVRYAMFVVGRPVFGAPFAVIRSLLAGMDAIYAMLVGLFLKNFTPVETLAVEVQDFSLRL